MLGSSLCETLAEDYEVFGLDLLDTGYSVLDTRFFIQCDITDKDSLVTALNGIKPDFIIHTAAYTDVDGCELNSEKAFAVNAQGTGNVVQVAEEFGATLIYISTDYVFDGKKDKPYIETDTCNPINIYGQSKLEGERIVQNRLERYYILRTSWLFGPKGKNFVTAVLQKVKENEALQVVNDQVGSPTYTIDLARAIKALFSTLSSRSPDIYGIYHISNSGSCSWYEFARQILSLKQLKTQVLPVSSKESNRPARRPRMSLLDNSKLMSAFNLKLRPWQEALKHFLEAK